MPKHNMKKKKKAPKGYHYMPNGKLMKNSAMKKKKVVIMPYSKYSAKQRKLAAVASPRNKLTGADCKVMKKKKK
jgi:hypothetical protein